MAKQYALVTGGSKRIGAAIVRDLADHGFGVAVHANTSMDEAETLVRDIKAAGGEAIAVQADLTAPETMAQLIDTVSIQLAPISVLINNASMFEADGLADTSSTTWDPHFAIHLQSPVMLTQAMAAALPGDQKGLVVNIIDQRVWRLTPHFFSYTLSKSALWTATQTMAMALAPRIRVNAIGPGPTLKNMRQADEDFAAQENAVLLGKGPELAEFGATIRYLWETPSITGQMIALDGGQHLAWETPDVILANE